MNKGQAYRAANAPPMPDAEMWDACVSSILGPVIAQADCEVRHRNALQLAAAALRAAGADDIAAQAKLRIVA
ncbi:hypothetical protein [Pandoraea sp. NPDC087047]|uniref:hypothetical protein n=1 Tax=Pandoraea sp. NPDC087047 TaxID=3364390 RepID=UPI0037FE4F55